MNKPAKAREPLHPFMLAKLLTEYLQSPSLDAAARRLEEYPELLEEGAEKLLESLSAFADDPRRAAIFRQFHGLAKTVGVRVAYEHVTAAAAQKALESFQESWAQFGQTQQNEDLDAAVAHATTVLESPALAQLSKEQRRQLFAEFGRCFYVRYKQSFASADLELASRLFRAAAELADSAAEQLRCHGFVGTCELSAFERTGGPQHLQTAIESLEKAIPGDAISANDPEQLALATSLGNALRARYQLNASAEDIRRAIALHEQLAALPAGSPTITAIRRTNLGASLMDHYARGSDLQVLRRAAEAFQAALDEPALTGDLRATAANNLARCREMIFAVAKDLEELRKAIQAFADSVHNTSADSPSLGRNLANYGHALANLASRTHDAAMLDQAISTMHSATGHLPEHEVEPGRTHTLLAEVLLARHAERHAAEDATAAIASAKTGVRLSPPETPRSWHALGVLAQALVAEGRELPRATELYGQAVRGSLSNGPQLAVRCALKWGFWAYERGAWNEAAEAFLLGLEAHQNVLRSQAGRVDKETRIKELQGLAPMAVWALAKAGDVRGAIQAAERGRALLLSEALAERDRAEPTLLAFEEIQALAESGPVVYLDAGLSEGLALVLRKDAEPACCWLPQLTERELRAQVIRYYDAYRQADTNRAGWETELEETTRWLWQAAAGPLIGVLEGHALCRIVAGYFLPLLPLHAAWLPDPQTPSGRRYFGDRLTLAFAPSARSLLHALAGSARQAASILCIEEPRPSSGSPLPNAAIEISRAHAKFPKHRVLRHGRATRSAVLRAASQCSVLHFCCHGSADLDQPLRSGLAMANDEVLTLADFFALDLRAARLAVLSACETGVMGVQLPDEAVSLPTGLLQAGVPGIVASLWSVTDLSCALLMARFYELWRDEGQAPAQALQAAQAWLRESTNAEKAEHFSEVEAFYVGLMLLEPDARDFSSPVNWAGFYYTGV